ncbi:WhiB family transcriptional regulator [Streptomyces fradiae]|uniref:WhiB family transcriptional regulator n=1 Tax=Streptomyces fradiae TaxID=1906 RepID=UPI003808644B
MHRQYIVRTVHAPSTLPATADWRAEAACRDEDPELFFPIGTTGAALLQIEEAKTICRRRCPVVEKCLRWALDHDEQHGVWGGTDETERRRMKRRAARKAALDAAV